MQVEVVTFKIFVKVTYSFGMALTRKMQLLKYGKEKLGRG